jgi:hypothetical protein
MKALSLVQYCEQTMKQGSLNYMPDMRYEILLPSGVWCRIVCFKFIKFSEEYAVTLFSFRPDVSPWDSDILTEVSHVFLLCLRANTRTVPRLDHIPFPDILRAIIAESPTIHLCVPWRLPSFLYSPSPKKI